MNTISVRSFADEASPLLEGQILAMKRNRHEGLEIRGINGHNISELSPSEAKAVKQRLAEEGLSVWSVGSPIGKIPVTADFAPHLELFRRMLENAAELGAKAFRLFSFYIPEHEDAIFYRDEVLLRLSRFLEAAEGYPIELCHENEKGIFGDIASRCELIHQALPSLHAVFDPANFIQCGQETWVAWELLKPYVRYLHVKDALENGVVVPAGEGIGHLREIIASYLAAGGRDFTLEPHLTVFKGMNALVTKFDDALVGKFEYRSADEAFDAASEALLKLVKEKGYEF